MWYKIFLIARWKECCQLGKFLLEKKIRYEDDDLKELTTKILRILKNELLIDGLDSNFDSNGNLKKEAVSTIKAIVNKVYPDDKID